MKKGEFRIVALFGRIILYGFLIGFVLLIFFPELLHELTGGTRGRYMRQQKHYAELFNAGSSNCPLLEMDWFDERGVHFCRVSQTGKGAARRDVGYAIQAGNSIELDRTNLNLLTSAIDNLPSSSTSFLPRNRQIVVGCIRSNRWFSATYDRGDIPEPIERITRITGAYLQWSVPVVDGHAVALSDHGNFLGAATTAPVAVTAQSGHLWVLNWNRPFNQFSDPIRFGGSPMLEEWEQPVGVSPDGSIFAIADDSGLYAFDCKDGKTLWKNPPLDCDSFQGIRLAVADNGKILYTAGAHVITKWNFVTGEKIAVLDTNQETVRFLKTSQNGKVLIAGFGMKYNWRPWSFAIWESGKNKPSLRFNEPQADGANADLSPDGEQIALSKFGTSDLILLNWRTNQRKEIHLPNSPGTYSVYWSPDGKRLAAYVDTYPASIYIYDTKTWKPIAQWKCGKIGEYSEFLFQKNGTLLQIRGNEINSLDVAALKN